MPDLDTMVLAVLRTVQQTRQIDLKENKVIQGKCPEPALYAAVPARIYPTLKKAINRALARELITRRQCQPEGLLIELTDKGKELIK